MQTALTSTWLRWSRVERQDAPEAYVRRVMVTTYVSWRRRRSYGETPVHVLPAVAALDDPAGSVVAAELVRQALAALPRRQRAVIVLGYFHDLTENQTADVLGIAVGTVKSQTSKAMTTLRALDALVDREELP